ncbi:MAG: flippase [Clostridia bacterium]|nr:flippase [Clostridia bacterium]
MNKHIIKNASWIIGARIVQAVLNLVVSIITVRYLGPSNFGLITYVASVTAFLLPLMNLGLNSILVNEFVKNPSHEGEIIGTSLVMNFVSGILCIGGSVAFVSIANRGERDTLIVCALYSLIFIFQSFELIQYWFQWKYLSKYTSLTFLGAYTAVSAYKIFLLATGKSVYWFALSNALDYLIIGAALMFFYFRLSGQRLHFSFERAKALFSKSRYYIVSSMMVTIFAQTDRIMLKLMINEEAVGYYSAAVTVAGMTSFVFAALIDSFRPEILECKKKSSPEYEANLKKLYAVIIYLSFIQSIAVTVFAELIVNIMYSSAFSASVPALRIIVWYTTFSYLGAVRNIWILAEGKQKYLWIINLSGAIMNVALNLILIPRFGINGAAAASLVTQIFTNVIINLILRPMREINRLLTAGLNPKNLMGILKYGKQSRSIGKT